MSGLHANTGEMNANGNSTVNCASDFAAELASLRSNVDNLMNIWKGPAASSFNNAFVEQATNFDNFQALLNELGERIINAANILNSADEDAASEAGRLF